MNIQFMSQLLHNFISLDPVTFVTTIGYIGIFLIIFAESGILLGIFLPGDSLLFAAGLLASHGLFNPLLLLFLSVIAAVAGDNTGYWIGKRGGMALFNAYPRLIKHDHIIRTERFYERWGGYAIIIARFIPIIRTIAPTLAGVGNMNYSRFVRFNVFGSLLWVSFIIGIGYTLGNYIQNIQDYLFPITVTIIALSFAPFLIQFVRRYT